VKVITREGEEKRDIPPNLIDLQRISKKEIEARGGRKKGNKQRQLEGEADSSKITTPGVDMDVG